MTDKPDGGEAFACASCDGHQDGMSLRDYFAGQALAGITANSEMIPELAGVIIRKGGSREQIDALVAKKAYEHADAIIAERQKDEA